MFKAAIIGYGFVGSALHRSFNENVKTYIVDPKHPESVTYEEATKADIVFLCVPTPMSFDGSVDASILFTCFMELMQREYKGLIVIKSTVPPNVFDVLPMYKGMRLVYNPEFLREKHADYDTLHPDLMVIGCDDINDSRDLFNFFDVHTQINMPEEVYTCRKKEASLVKYTINCFLATKVLFFNQIKDVCDNTYDVRYDAVKHMVSADPRIGETHMDVPGHDGRRGFGGACFAKDTAAFITFSQSKGAEFTLLKKAVEINNSIRSKYDTLDPREAEQNVKFQ
jgi:UDPglucose 6-dehydrogenase